MKRMTILSKILCLVLLVTTIIFSMPINASEPNIYEVETIANQDNYEKYLSDSEKAIELFGDLLWQGITYLQILESQITAILNKSC